MRFGSARRQPLNPLKGRRVPGRVGAGRSNKPAEAIRPDRDVTGDRSPVSFPSVSPQNPRAARGRKRLPAVGGPGFRGGESPWRLGVSVPRVGEKGSWRRGGNGTGVRTPERGESPRQYRPRRPRGRSNQANRRTRRRGTDCPRGQNPGAAADARGGPRRWQWWVGDLIGFDWSSCSSESCGRRPVKMTGAWRPGNGRWASEAETPKAGGRAPSCGEARRTGAANAVAPAGGDRTAKGTRTPRAPPGSKASQSLRPTPARPRTDRLGLSRQSGVNVAREEPGDARLADQTRAVPAPPRRRPTEAGGSIDQTSHRTTRTGDLGGRSGGGESRKGRPPASRKLLPEA